MAFVSKTANHLSKVLLMGEKNTCFSKNLMYEFWVELKSQLPREARLSLFSLTVFQSTPQR